MNTGGENNTLTVRAIPRSEIDRWPVEDSGLPARVVNSTRAAGMTKLGDVRQSSQAQLLAIRSLGRISLAHINEFFRLCDRIEQGLQRFDSIRDVFAILLDEVEFQVLAARYGLTLETPKASRNCVTLQEIGNAQRRTRERVRQIEDNAKQRLRSRLASVCLEPFYEYLGRYIDRQGQVLAPDETTPLREDRVVSGYNTAGLLLLLYDLDGRSHTFFSGFFSTLPEGVLEAIRAALMRALESKSSASSLDELVADIAPAWRDRPVREPRRMVELLLLHAQEVAATVDGRYFLHRRGIHRFLEELLQEVPRPAHYRMLTQAFNERVRSGSRKGAGYILERLSEGDRFRRVERGIYDLR